MSALVKYAEGNSAAIRPSASDAARSASGSITRDWSASAEPAYNLTVEIDECYFVRGDDGRAYLVSNSSHGSDAFGLMAVAYEMPRSRPKKLKYQQMGIV